MTLAIELCQSCFNEVIVLTITTHFDTEFCLKTCIQLKNLQSINPLVGIRGLSYRVTLKGWDYKDDLKLLKYPKLN